MTQLGLAFLDSRISLTVSPGEFGPPQHKVSDGIFVRLNLLRIQGCWVNGFVLGIQAFVCTQAGEELRDFGEHVVVGGPQNWRVGYAVQVTDGAPGSPQFLGGDIENTRHVSPAGREIGCGHGFQGRIGLF